MKSDQDSVEFLNVGGPQFDCFNSVIEFGDYYIAVGADIDSKLVVCRFNKSDLSLDCMNNLDGKYFGNFHSVIETQNYFIAVGFSYSDLSGLPGGSTFLGRTDFLVARFKKDSLQLDRISNFGGKYTDVFTSVVSSDNYYVAVGYSNSYNSEVLRDNKYAQPLDFIIARITKRDLSIDSINEFGGAERDHFNSLIESENAYIAVGYSESDLSDLLGAEIADKSSGLVVAKFNKENLDLEYICNTDGIGYNEFQSVIDDGDYCIAVGSSSSDLSMFTGGASNSGNSDFIIARINKSDLSIDRINYFGGKGYDGFSELIASEDYYIAVGSSSSDLSMFTGGARNSGNFDFVIARFNKSDLSLVNINNHGGTGREEYVSVIGSGNSYTAVGYTVSDLSNSNREDYFYHNGEFVIARYSAIDLTLDEINFNIEEPKNESAGRLNVFITKHEIK